MKVFNHKPLTNNPLKEIICEDRDGKRFYITPLGDYPSITTVLSTISKPFIEKWRKRIGEKKADEILKHAQERGTALHLCLENFLKNNTVTFPEDPSSKVRIMFQKLKRIFLEDVDNIIAQEIPLYSDELKVAGRCDCIAEYKGVLSILDFKGATHFKEKEWIETYFLQATAYSKMFLERTGIDIKQIVILMTSETDFSRQVFVEKTDDYVVKLIDVCKNAKL